MDLTPFIEAIADRVAQKMCEQKPAADPAQLAGVLLRTEIDPMRVYSAKDVARLLAIGQNSVYEIPESRLPLVRRTGKNGYRGINVLLYSMGLDPIDEEVVGKRLREEFLNRHQAPPVVRSVGGGKSVARVV